MRFFFSVCLFGIFVASLGCMTENWSSPLFKQKTGQQDGGRKVSADLDVFSGQGNDGPWFGSGVDPRAREIEDRLGYNRR